MLSSKMSEVQDELRRTQAARDEIADAKQKAEQEVMKLKSSLQNMDSYSRQTEERMRENDAKIQVSCVFGRLVIHDKSCFIS